MSETVKKYQVDFLDYQDSFGKLIFTCFIDAINPIHASIQAAHYYINSVDDEDYTFNAIHIDEVMK